MEFEQSPLFPLDSRKCVPRLYSLSKKKTKEILSEVCKINLRSEEVRRVRRYLRSNLSHLIITDIMSVLVPSDKWKFPCAQSNEILECRIHPECALGKDSFD